MKSNYCTTVNRAALRRELTRQTEARINERADEIQKEVEFSVATQMLAVTLWILHRDHGWGRERLNRLKNEIEDEFVLMHKGIMGKTYNPVDLREKLKTEYGVDFDRTRYEGGIEK